MLSIPSAQLNMLSYIRRRLRAAHLLCIYKWRLANEQGGMRRMSNEQIMLDGSR